MTASTTFQSVVDAKLQQFREEIRPGQEEASTKAVKRARYEKPYTLFSKRRNEEQATFNAQLKAEEALSRAKSALFSIPVAPTISSDIQRVLMKLQLLFTWPL